MRIAFYAPMKAPNHPSPSGDRRVAQLLWHALEDAGHQVSLASELRSYDGKGDQTRQARIEQKGKANAAQLIGSWRAGSAESRAELWFTYHLYHKAPDWLGPEVSQALGIPYVVAEASVARKQANGPHARGFAASVQAVARADAILSFTPEDEEALVPFANGGASLHRIAPFLDPAPYEAARAERESHRTAIAKELSLDPARPWLLAVAMMRAGDKLASYRLLGRSLCLIADPPWQLIAVGDGEARDLVEEALRPIGASHVAFVGARDGSELPAFYAAADLFVWPAVNEAYGMALLEAAASGLPIVAGGWRGVPEIVSNGENGVLIAPWHDADFAEAVVSLIGNEKRRQAMTEAALQRVRKRHDIAAASATLTDALNAAIAAHAGRAS